MARPCKMLLKHIEIKWFLMSDWCAGIWSVRTLHTYNRNAMILSCGACHFSKVSNLARTSCIFCTTSAAYITPEQPKVQKRAHVYRNIIGFWEMQIKHKEFQYFLSPDQPRSSPEQPWAARSNHEQPGAAHFSPTARSSSLQTRILEAPVFRPLHIHPVCKLWF